MNKPRVLNLYKAFLIDPDMTNYKARRLGLMGDVSAKFYLQFFKDLEFERKIFKKMEILKKVEYAELKLLLETCKSQPQTKIVKVIYSGLTKLLKNYDDDK